MSTFTQIKSNITENLNDSGVTYFTQADVDTATQQAYDLTVALSQCIIKTTTLNFQDNLTYYDFTDITNFPNIFVSDFLACTAIFNNNTNLWLLDDKVIRDFSRDRIDWENWNGQPVWWAPCNDGRKVAIVPKLTVATGDFKLYYYATAETVVNGSTPQIPGAFQNLVEFYGTFSLLADAQEYDNSQLYWDEFFGIDEDGNQNFDKGIFALAAQSKNIAQSDLLLLG